MFLSDLSKIVFAFCFGVLLSAFSSGLLMLPLFMILFFIVDFSISNGKIEYCYMEHRASVIYYGFLGFILGRMLHGMCVSPLYLFHKKEQTGKLEKIPAVIIDLYNDLDFIESIKHYHTFNLYDRRYVKEGEIFYYFYRKIYNNSPKEIVEFITKLYNNSEKCLVIHKHNSYIHNILYYKLKTSRIGIDNIIKKYPEITNDLNNIRKKITEL